MKAKQGNKKPRNRYSAEFRKQELDRADKESVASVAKDLGLAESQLYAWRQERRLNGLTTEAEKLQQGEIAQLRRDMARLSAVTIFDGLMFTFSDGPCRHAPVT